VSTAEIDAYLANVDEPKRSTLQRLRRTILEVIPDAEEGISYGLPAFRVQGKVVAGFAAFKNHLSYLPHSGSVFPVLRDELGAYKTSTGALRFPIDSPLPKLLVEHLVKVRVAQAFPDEQELAAADPAMQRAGKSPIQARHLSSSWRGLEPDPLTAERRSELTLAWS